MQTIATINRTSHHELMTEPLSERTPLSTAISETLTVSKLVQWLTEIQNQPRWRLVADKENAYYDGNQYDAETLTLMEERGQAPIIDNMIQPTINSVLGMQAKSRVDTRVAPEAGETNTDVAEALSLKMKQVSETCRADRAKSEAYGEQVKVGVGWVEVARDADPFSKTGIRYTHVHRREIFWDWRAREPDLSDARYLVRRKWLDEDILLTTFPEHAEFIRNALAGRMAWDVPLTGAELLSRGIDSDLVTGFSQSIEQYEWMNTTRRRLTVYEVWYRVRVSGHLIKLPNGRVIEYNEDDPQHQQAFYARMIRPFTASFDRVRVSFWIGPKLVDDRPSPYKHRYFPYVPFFGMREDKTGIPYGLIRSMISPQDEVNARKSKMLWLLNAKRVTATEGAVADHKVAADEIARPDAYVIVSNKPGELFKVEENGPMAAQQFTVMQEAKESIQTNVGVHNATLGRDSGATSGLAINSLVEQDSITLAEINDNFNMAARQADELLLSLIIEDLSDTDNEVVTVEDDAGAKRDIVLNQKTVDELTGMPTIINDVTKINVAVVLADTPTTPTFRNQQLNQMSDVMKALPPNVQAMLLPLYIRATDLPMRKQMADIIIKGLGLQTDDANQDPEKQQLKQQIQQAMDKIQELEQQLKAKNPPEVVAAMVRKMLAEEQKILADTANVNTDTLNNAVVTAGQVVANHTLVPVADQLAKSAGFNDLDGGDIVDQVPEPTAPVRPDQQGVPEQVAQPTEQPLQ